MIKTAILFGGSYAIGDIAGAKIAAAAGATSSGAVTGTKIGTGVIAFFVLSMILR